MSSAYTSVHNLATHMCHLPYNCHLHSQWARLRHTEVACHMHVSFTPALTETRRSGSLFLFYFTACFPALTSPLDSRPQKCLTFLVLRCACCGRCRLCGQCPGIHCGLVRRSTTSLGTCSSQSETLRGFSHELNPNALRDDRCVDGLVKNVCVSFQTPPTSGPTETALRV